MTYEINTFKHRCSVCPYNVRAYDSTNNFYFHIFYNECEYDIAILKNNTAIKTSNDEIIELGETDNITPYNILSKLPLILTFK